MKAKFGAIIVAGSGKIGGHVASRNRAGAYLRTKVTPVNPQTASQLVVRNRLAALSSAWRGLTQPQRDAWNAAVGDFQKTDIFGDLKSPSGFNLHQRLNNNLNTIGELTIQSPPAVDQVEISRQISVTANLLGSILTIGMDGAVPATSKVKVFATPSLSPGVNFVKSEYRLIEVIDPAVVSPLDVFASYVAKFGAMTEGQKLFIRVVFVDVTSGLQSVPQSDSTIILNA